MVKHAMFGSCSSACFPRVKLTFSTTETTHRVAELIDHESAENCRGFVLDDACAADACATGVGRFSNWQNGICTRSAIAFELKDCWIQNQHCSLGFRIVLVSESHVKNWHCKT